MSVYVVTGKLGNGKTLVTVGRIRDALYKHVRVVTNLDLNLKAMFGRNARNIEVVRIPDKPTIEDLEAIGQGYDGPYDEEKFGLLVLDECGTWFNSRNWQDKSRKAVNDWFLHARKLRWHVYLIIQDIALLDSQARDSIAELIVTCRRLDNLRIPVIAPIVKAITGFNVKFPRIHRAKVTYADGLVSDVWTYQGNDLFACYQTDQLFLAEYPHAPHCLLTPWHTHGRHGVKMTWRNYMRLTKIYWKKFSSPVALATGLLLGGFAMMYKTAQPVDYSLLPPVQAADVPQDVESVLQADPMVERLKLLYISGVLSVDGIRRYQFSRPDSSETAYTSTDLSLMGVSLAAHGDCRVDATWRTETVHIYCL